MIDERTDEKQIEIIAEKPRTVAYIFLAFALLGILVAAAGVYLFIAFRSVQDNVVFALKISLVVCGLVLAAVFGGLFIKQLFRPYALVILQKGALEFPDGTTCKPEEISEINKEKKVITVKVGDKVIALNSVADPDNAYRKLAMLEGKHAEIQK